MKKLIIIIILLAILAGAYWYKNQNTKNIDIKKDTLEYSSKEIGVSFEYPNELSVNEIDGTISIFHDIPFKNTGSCDMEGDEETVYPKLTDFDVQIQRFNTPLVETVKNLSSYVPEENFADGKLLENPGFIDKVTIGSFGGFSIYEGAEGCGHTIYYFPISENRTLVVTKASIQALSGVRGQEIVDQILKVEGSISKEKSDQIFTKIIASLTLE